MIGTCWSSSLWTSLINSAFSPVRIFPLAALSLPGSDQGQGRHGQAETPAARVKKERRDEGTSGAFVDRHLLNSLFIVFISSVFVATDEHQPEPDAEAQRPLPRLVYMDTE